MYILHDELFSTDPFKCKWVTKYIFRSARIRTHAKQNSYSLREPFMKPPVASANPSRELINNKLRSETKSLKYRRRDSSHACAIENPSVQKSAYARVRVTALYSTADCCGTRLPPLVYKRACMCFAAATITESFSTCCNWSLLP